MKPFARIKLVSQFLDLPIIDRDERWCGIVDDIELSGGPGAETRVKALVVGPGAYRGRMPAWMYWIVRTAAGERMVRVPADEVVEIGAVVKLGACAETLGLHQVEDKVREWIPRRGAM